jgi:hypothetical protein
VGIDSFLEMILGGGGGGRGENEVYFSVKNQHFMGHGRLDSMLGSYSVPGIDFSSPSPS